MKCPVCATEIQPGQKFCPTCGTQQRAEVQPEAQPTVQPWSNTAVQPAAAMPQEDRTITKSVFYKDLASDKVRKNIRASAILCYISAVVTGIFGIIFNPLMLLDSAILLALGLLIHLKQSRVCAIILLVYGVVSCLITLIQSGRFTAWLIILAGVFAIIYTFQLETEYRVFRGA